jgi:tetratricopeptide (TPR) repeat protein
MIDLLARRAPLPFSQAPARHASRHTALVLALGLWVSSCQSSGPKVDPEIQRAVHVEAARNHYDIGDLDRAIDQAERALVLDEDDINMKLLIAWCYLRKDRKGDLLEAERIFLGLEKRYKDESRAPLGTAIVSERLAMLHRNTAQDIERGLEVPLGKDPQKEIERLRGEEKRLFARASERYEQLIEEQDDHIEALTGLVRVNTTQGATETALTYSGRLITTLEAQEIFYSEQLRDQAWDRSVEDDFKRLLRNTTTRLIRAHQLAAELHFDLGRSSLALGHLDQAIERDPNASPELYAQRAQVLLSMERPERALEDLERFIANSSLPVDHPDVQEAWQLRRDAREAIARPDR